MNIYINNLTNDNGKYTIPGLYYIDCNKYSSPRTTNFHIFMGSKEIMDKNTKFIRYTSWQEDFYVNNVKKETIAQIMYKRINEEYITPQPKNNIFEDFANNKINVIKSFFPDDLIIAAMHVGSTSIPNIKARACIVLNIAVTSVEEVHNFLDNFLEKTHSKIIRSNQKEVMVEMGITEIDYYAGVTYYIIYFIKIFNRQWIMKRDFRNYMRSHPEEAKRYENLKETLAKDYIPKINKLEEERMALEERLKGEKDSRKAAELRKNFEKYYVRSREHYKHELYAKKKAPYILSILHKCGHKKLYLNPDPNHGVEGDGCISGQPEIDLPSYYQGGRTLWNMNIQNMQCLYHRIDRRKS